MALACPRCDHVVEPGAVAGAPCKSCGEPVVALFDPSALEVVDVGERTGAPPRFPEPAAAEPPSPPRELAGFAPPSDQTFELDPAWEAERRAKQAAAQRPPARTGPGPAGVIVALVLIAVVAAALVYVAR